MTKYIQKPFYIEEHGCNRLGQCTPYFCGPHATKQAMAKLNDIDISEYTIAKVMGTTKNGTGHPQINYFIKWFNKKYKTKYNIQWKNFSSFGKTTAKRFEEIGKIMSKKNNAVYFHLCYRQKYGHYEIIREINTNNNTVKVLNSLGTVNSNGSYQGYIENRSYRTQQAYISGISQPSVCIITKK